MPKKLVYTGQFVKVYQEGNKYVLYYKSGNAGDDIQKISSHINRDTAISKAKAINKRVKDTPWWDR